MTQTTKLYTSKLLRFDVQGEPLFDVAIAGQNDGANLDTVSGANKVGDIKPSGVAKAAGVGKAVGLVK